MARNYNYPNYADFSPVEHILDIAVQKQETKHDSCFLVCGKVRKGKSTFILHCADYLKKAHNFDITINNICPDLESFISVLGNSPPKSAIFLDEGRKLSSISHFDKLNKAFVEAFEVMGEKGFITFLVFTNPSKIQTYFREDRIKGLFFIKSRGIVFFYPINLLTGYMSDIMKKQYKSIEVFLNYTPRFSAVFQEYKGDLLEEYAKIKSENIDLILHRLKSEFGEPKTFTLRECTRLLNCSPEYLKKFVSAGLLKVKPSLSGRVWRISETDFIKFKSDYIINKPIMEAKEREKEAKKLKIEFESDIQKNENKTEVESNKE